MKSTLTLNQLINQRVFPRLLTVVLILIALIIGTVFLFAQQQLNQRHNEYINDVERELTLALDNRVQQIANLAANDLVINSLIDVSQRDNYLPLFFQSLKVSKAEDVSIAFFDFAGEQIIGKNWSGFTDVMPDFNWTESVLENSQTYSAFSEQGMLVAAPVLLGDMAEGALVMYSPSLQETISHRENSAIQLILSSPGNQVLFSSFPELYPPKSQFELASDLVGFNKVQQYSGYTIVTMEATGQAYRGIFVVILMAILSVTAIIIVSLYSTRLAVKHASSTLESLNRDIAQQLSSDLPQESVEDDIQAVELISIKESFHHLIQELVHITLSKDKLSDVFNSMSEIVVVLDNDSQVVLKNSSYRELAKNIYMEDEDDIFQVIPTALFNRISRGDSCTEQYYRVAGEEKGRYIRWQTTDFNDDKGQKIGTVVVGEDITLERELQSDLLMKTQAIDEAKTSIVISDVSQPGQPVVYVNKAYHILTGYSYEEIVGGNCKSLQGKDTSIEDINKIREAISRREAIDITLLNYRKDGSSFLNRLTLTPIRNNDGSITHYIGIQQDVTMQEQTAQFLREAKTKAEESARLKSGFLASMSHEIRTPINGISGMLQLLSASELNDKQREFADLAKQSTDNLLHIINDILDFSKIEAGRLIIEETEFNLSRLIELTSDHFDIEVEQANLTFLVDKDFRPDIHVIGDPTRIRQVISNLLSNAIKFTQQGEIELSASLDVEEGDGMVLRCNVRDTGIGIAEEKLEHIFDVFTQEDVSTTREFGGTGLGLSICKQLCELMGGDIGVESEKGKGSTFSFYVPIKPGKPKHKAAAVSRKEVTANGDQQNVKSGYTPAILLVEDNEINQVVAKNQLEQYRVLVANNGKEALNALNHYGKKIDLVLMDCQMPEMDGFEATKRIRDGKAGETIMDIPIIALTANAMVGDREQCLDAGMNDYLSKPFTAKDLHAKVNEWISVSE